MKNNIKSLYEFLLLLYNLTLCNKVCPFPEYQYVSVQRGTDSTQQFNKHINIELHFRHNIVCFFTNKITNKASQPPVVFKLIDVDGGNSVILHSKTVRKQTRCNKIQGVLFS